MKKPELKDFGLTNEMIAEARKRKEELIAARGREERIILRVGPLVILLLLTSAAALGWSGGGFSAALDYVLVTILLGGFVLAAVLYFTNDDKPKQRDPVMQSLERFNDAVKEHAAALEREKREFWETLDGLDFEHELAAVLSKADYSVEVTRGSGDDGVDIWAQKDEETIAIQCKRYGGAVGPAVIRELYGVLMHLDADRGIVATTGYFTQGAIDFAQDKPIDLWTLDDILKLQRDKDTKAG